MTEKSITLLPKKIQNHLTSWLKTNATTTEKKTDSRPTIAKHLYCSINLNLIWVSKFTKLSWKEYFST